MNDTLNTAHTTEIRQKPEANIISIDKNNNDVTKQLKVQVKKIDLCQKVVPFRSVSPTTISTFDLPDVTDYSLDATRNYKLPQEVYNRSKEPLKDELQVIIVPFSHADPGYGMTVEDYYQRLTRSKLN